MEHVPTCKQAKSSPIVGTVSVVAYPVLVIPLLNFAVVPPLVVVRLLEVGDEVPGIRNSSYITVRQRTDGLYLERDDERFSRLLWRAECGDPPPRRHGAIDLRGSVLDDRRHTSIRT